MSERTRPPPTHFTEGEVAELLRRAAALEQKRKLERPTLSLDEVEAIAKEAGLDPALVRRAAHELQHEPRQTLSTRLAGAPVTRTLERVVDGEVTAEDHEALAAAIREALGSTGLPTQVATLGRSLTLTTVGPGGLVELHVSPREGTTIIRLTLNASQLAGGLFGGLIGGIGGGLGSNVAWLVPTWLSKGLGLGLPESVLAGVVGFLGVTGAAFGLARWLFTRRVGAAQARLEQLADTLEALVRQRVVARAGITAVSAPSSAGRE
ncbi:MAG: hypothetical protein SFW67_10755 [Myxococcaceae bacterium]|nr:hypothetical protein [Myxococcaceae bacterium]